MKQILTTERLCLREIEHDDYKALAAILQDTKVMQAYEHAFSDNEVKQWLDRQRERYKHDGYGLWAVVLKETHQMIGQCGLSCQHTDTQQVVEVGYLFQKEFWGKGYATEAAIACKEYAFSLGYKKVYSIIRDNNVASQKVAKRNGMKKVGEFTKFYYGIEMPHYIYMVENS